MIVTALYCYCKVPVPENKKEEESHMDYQNAAADIIKCVGGKDNINSLMHCATRLRFVLNNQALIDQEALDQLDIAKGTFYTNGQYQIIIGAGTVNLVYDEINKQLGRTGDETSSATAEETSGNLIQRGVKLLSDIFVPIIPAIVAGGLLMGLNNILTANFFDGQSIISMYPQFADLAGMINLFANAPFTFLPVLLGFSATKKFGGNPYLGAAMGMIMVHPELLNAYSLGTGVEIPVWNVFGLTIDAVGYQGTVLPVLAVSYILATVEKRLHKVTPSWLDNLTTPLIAILFTAFLTFTIVGPIMRGAGDLLAQGITWMYTSLGFVGGALFGGFYAPIVITGMHHSFIAIETQLIADMANTGGSFIFVTAAMSNVAQGAAVLAVLMITKNEKMKSLCSASGISALLGITEPAMFGVNLKLRYPFIAACIGSACGSAWIALNHILAIALGAAGLPGFISVEPKNWLNFGIGLVIAMAVSFAMTLVLGKRQEAKETNAVQLETASSTTIAEHPQVAQETICSPCDGFIKAMSEASDSVFAQKAMGDGFVVEPNNGNIYAPCDGDIVMIFPSKHAIGLSLSDGSQVLLHCGMDTVTLNGEGFEVHVSEHQHVTKGTLLLTMDLEFIKNKGCGTEIPVVITELANGKTMNIMKSGECEKGETILSLE